MLLEFYNFHDHVKASEKSFNSVSSFPSQTVWPQNTPLSPSIFPLVRPNPTHLCHFGNTMPMHLLSSRICSFCLHTTFLLLFTTMLTVLFLNISRYKNKKSKESKKEYEKVTSEDLALPQVWMTPSSLWAVMHSMPVYVNILILLIIFMLSHVLSWQ